jgi:autotransporter adhesin
VQSNSVAIGSNAVAVSSVAVGTGAQATGTNTTALGDNALAAGNLSVALGNNAQAMHDNSVALGNASLTSDANTVSVGSAGNERRVTNVAGPVNATDAVNKQYVDTLISTGSSDTLLQANAYTDQQIGALRKEAFRGIAQAAALIPLAPAGAGETTVNVGVATYGGETGGGIAVAHQLGSRLNLNGGVGFSSGGKSLVRAGMGWRF